jgi:two-component system chemotaxis response regulator CheY
MSDLRVLSVGQCGYDHGRLSRFLRDTFATATDRVDTTDEAIDALRSGQYGVVLVNRVFDGDGASGLALIGAIKADAALAHLPTMLVSNYPEAQAEATSLGAFAGFGKADLGKSKAREAFAAVFEAQNARSY